MDTFASERLLLALLRGAGGAPTDRPAADPRAFIDLCLRHRVAGLIYPAVARAEILPQGTVALLREASRKILVDNLILLKALLDLASVLREEGTGFVVLKGASLLGFLYPEIQQRQMSDLDLLIREKDWPKVAETLGQRGYRLPPQEEERFYGENWYHQLVETPGSPSCNVEFHWNLESVERSRIDPDDLIHDAVTCELEGEKFLRLCDDHLLLHLAVHLAHHYRNPSLLWVEDIRRLLSRGRLDWNRIRSTAREWGAESCLAYSLLYVDRAFPGSVPEAALGIHFSPLRGAILRSFRTSDPTLPHRPLAGNPMRHALSMALLDRWRDAARYAAVHSISRMARALGMPGPRPPAVERGGRKGPREQVGPGFGRSASSSGDDKRGD